MYEPKLPHGRRSIEGRRGTVENTNGLVRHYLRKRSSFADLTQQRLDEIAALLESRPRKCLGYSTPNELHLKRKSLRTLNKCCTTGNIIDAFV